MRGVFVTGTDTGVGKTGVGTRLVRALTAGGRRVRVRKPVESGCTEEAGVLLPADAQALQAAAGAVEPLAAVCRYRLRAAVSPERAARLEGLEFTIAELAAACLEGVEAGDFLHVEGAGGLYSPLAADGLNVDLATQLGLPVLLVVGDRLGAINHALLSLEALERRGLRLGALVVNAFAPPTDPAMDNAVDLRALTGLPVYATPYAAEGPIYGELATLLAGPA